MKNNVKLKKKVKNEIINNVKIKKAKVNKIHFYLLFEKIRNKRLNSVRSYYHCTVTFDTYIVFKLHFSFTEKHQKKRGFI